MRIAASSFIGNKSAGDGGAIASTGGYGSLTVAASNFNGNVATGSGGAIYNSGKDTMISDVIIAGNIAKVSDVTKGGGGLANDQNGTVTVIRSSFAGNLSPSGSGGGIFNNIQTTMVISDTSFNGNLAGTPPTTETRGGGIYNMAVMTIYSSSLLNNGVDNGGGVFNGNIYTAATFSNSIIDSNVGGNCCQGLNTLGHNLSSEPLANTTSCNLIAPGDKSNADPKLKFPFYNGGPIAGFLTQEPAEGSAAIDAGDPAICAASPINNLDQRGEPRPKNGDGVGGPVCDIGAYEADDLAAGYGSDPTPNGTVPFGNVFLGQSAGASLKIFETGNTKLKVSNPVFSGGNPGDFSVPAAFTLTVADGAPAGNLPVTCKPTALGIRTATLTMHTTDLGKPSVSFNLTCTGIPTPPPYLVPGGSSTGGVVPLTNPYGVAVSPDGKFVYATGATSDSVAVYSRNQTTGALTLVQSLTLPELDGARGVTVSPDGKSVYVAAAAADAVVAFKRDSANGFVTKIDVVKDGDSYFCNNQACPLNGLDGAYNVKVSPDSRYLYITGATDDSIVVLFRDLTTGRIASVFGVQYVETITDATDLNDVRGLALSPDGAYLYAAVYGADNLMVYSRNISGVTVAPDGRHVYATGYAGKSTVVFERKLDTGALSYLQSVTRAPFTGAGGNPPLDGAREVATSPDGKNVYVAAYVDNRVVRLDVANPIPLIESITPSSVTVLGPDFTMNIYGKDFMPTSKVFVDNALNPRTTTFISSEHLTMVVTAGDAAINGIADITVVNPAPGGGTSNGATFKTVVIAASSRAFIPLMRR